MNYKQLRYRCQRITGMLPRDEGSLHRVMDCVSDMRPWARSIAVECIARELVNFIEDQKATYADL